MLQHDGVCAQLQAQPCDCQGHTHIASPVILLNPKRFASWPCPCLHGYRCIKYVSAISARHGAILLKPVIGTYGKGYTPPKVYKVRKVG